MTQQGHPARSPSLDDYRAARIIIEQFGDRAEQEVDRHATALLEAGDQAGVARWMNVLTALQELRQTTWGINELH